MNLTILQLENGNLPIYQRHVTDHKGTKITQRNTEKNPASLLSFLVSLCDLCAFVLIANHSPPTASTT